MTRPSKEYMQALMNGRLLAKLSDIQEPVEDDTGPLGVEPVGGFVSPPSSPERFGWTQAELDDPDITE
jgi:hypothetical protein